MPRTKKKEKNIAKKNILKEDVAKKSKNVEAYFDAVGRRKTAVARVRILKGKGTITINAKTLEQYFPEKHWQNLIVKPLELVGQKKNFDLSVLVNGGGVMSQAEAIRHGIARALEKFDSQLRLTLKKAGLLTRDSREKERKKYGLKRARRAPQYSKR